MRRHLFVAVTALLVLTNLLCAQSQQILPSPFQASEGETYTGFPFGQSHSVRLQHYYAPNLFSGPGTITGVSFRPEGGAAYASKGVDVEILCCTSKMNTTQITNNFVTNYGAHLTVVFQRKVLNLPLVANQQGPRAFSLSFVFDTPFAFDPQNGGLLMEIKVHGQARGSWDLDVGVACNSAQGSFGQPGCTGSNLKVPLADVPTTSVLLGGQLVFRVSDVTPQLPVALIFGLSEGGNWGGIPLPLDMAPFGAPGCYLNTEILALQGAVSNSVGEARFLGAIPNIPAFLGYWIRYQGLVLDGAANAFGITMTSGAKVQICGPFPVSRVVGSTVNAFLGTLEPGIVPVTELRWQ